MMNMTKLFKWRPRNWVSYFFASDKKGEDKMAIEAERKILRQTRDNIIRSGLQLMVSDQDIETTTAANNSNMIINRVDTISNSDSDWIEFDLDVEEFIIFGYRDDDSFGLLKSDKPDETSSTCLVTTPRTSSSVNGKVDYDLDSDLHDEEYIIFGFRDDDSFGLVKSGRPDEASSNFLDTTSRTSSFINRNVYYEENTDKCNDQERSFGKVHDNVSLINQGVSYQKEMKEENMFLNAELVSETINLEEHKRASVLELSDSVESSHIRSSSFTFPVLMWEWIGSPQRMPNTQGSCLKKHNACYAGF